MSDNALPMEHNREPSPPWDMYVVGASLCTGYILVPLLVSNGLLLLNPFVSLSGQFFIQQGATLLTWSAIFTWLRFRYGPIRSYLGLSCKTQPPRYYVWESIRLLLLTSGLTLLLNQLWTMLEQIFPAWHLEQNEPYSHYSAPELLMLSFFAITIAPILEEIIFRGFVQSTFHKISPPIRSVIFTCLVFLLFHGSYFDNIKALSHVLVLGLCFGFWRERTRSLLPGMVVHFLNNSVASVVLLLHHKP